MKLDLDRLERIHPQGSASMWNGVAIIDRDELAALVRIARAAVGVSKSSEGNDKDNAETVLWAVLNEVGL